MNETANKPGYVELGYRYTRAIVRWIKAGRPIRTEERIADVYEICLNCRAMDKETHSCRYCGCRLGTGANPLLNKIAMATERCPVGKWDMETFLRQDIPTDQSR